MRVFRGRDLGHLLICILLVRDTHLMIARDFGLARSYPFGGADKVLCPEARVAKDLWVAGHVYEVIGGHGFPESVEEGAVVNLRTSKLLIFVRGGGKWTED